MEKLKPCPFCGGKAKLKVIPNYYGEIHWVKCQECNAETPSDFEEVARKIKERNELKQNPIILFYNLMRVEKR